MTRVVPAVVATDLDGTLLRSDGTVSDRTRAALQAVQNAGATVVFVTGRPPRHLAVVAEMTGHRGVAICANGALVLDLATEEVIDTHAFADGIAMATLQRLREACPDLVFGVEWSDGFAHEAAYPRGIRQSENARGAAQAVESIEDLFVQPVVKLLARHDTLSSEDLSAQVADAVADVATVTHSTAGLLEISAVGVTKAFALQQFAEDHGAAAKDVTAFGDMPNDLAMLEWAGWSVAVANAHPDVQAIVDEVTASNDEDGVGIVLERWLANA